MVAFIFGFLIVIFSKVTGVRIFGMFLEVIGIFMIIAHERTEAELRCHMQTCPGCYKYEH